MNRKRDKLAFEHTHIKSRHIPSLECHGAVLESCNCNRQHWMCVCVCVRSENKPRSKSSSILHYYLFGLVVLPTKRCCFLFCRRPSSRIVHSAPFASNKVHYNGVSKRTPTLVYKYNISCFPIIVHFHSIISIGIWNWPKLIGCGIHWLYLLPLLSSPHAHHLSINILPKFRQKYKNTNIYLSISER